MQTLVQMHLICQEWRVNKKIHKKRQKLDFTQLITLFDVGYVLAKRVAVGTRVQSVAQVCVRSINDPGGID